MDKKSFLMRNGGEIGIGAAVLAALYLTSLQSYILFHSIIELFTIIVAGGALLVAACLLSAFGIIVLVR